jgi:hypothetical protein
VIVVLSELKKAPRLGLPGRPPEKAGMNDDVEKHSDRR